MPRPVAGSEQLASRLRTLRGPRSQQAVATETGVSVRAYQSWEAGHGISWPNLESLAYVLGVDPAQLLDTATPANNSGVVRASAPIEAELAKRLGRLHHTLEAALDALSISATSDGADEQQAAAGDQTEDPDNESCTLEAGLDVLEGMVHRLLELALERQLNEAASDASGARGARSPIARSQ